MGVIFAAPGTREEWMRRPSLLPKLQKDTKRVRVGYSTKDRKMLRGGPH
jgi:hypothetical protein